MFATGVVRECSLDGFITIHFVDDRLQLVLDEVESTFGVPPKDVVDGRVIARFQFSKSVYRMKMAGKFNGDGP